MNQPMGAGGPPQGMPAGGPPFGAGGPPQGMPAGGPPFGAGGPPQGAGGPPFGAGGPPQGGRPYGAPSPGDAPAGGIDPISGAYSMQVFGPLVGRILATSRPEHLALWYVDIRGFRSVNPKFGFEFGNFILRTLVDGIREFIADDLPVTRLGGDRIVFLSAGRDFDECAAQFDALSDYVNDRIQEQGVAHTITIVGGLYYMRDEDFEAGDFKRALDYTSIAHKNARDVHSGALLMFSDEDLERDNRRIFIEQHIDEALANGEIEVWYQPQIDYTLGEIIGAEALARWHSPELGWISPAEFVPVLENCGKVHVLDLFVWEEACRNAGRWQSMSDGRPVPISVNVSRTEMLDPSLVEHFLRLRAQYNLPKGCIHLEVTESAFVEEAERLQRVVDRMRANHMMVEIDDFGSGLSSLNMLKDIKVDVVKLDMGFMRSAVNEERGGVVLSSVIRMLQGLDTPIIAEGVETLEQAEMLKNMGCRLMQGFHFSRPLPLEEFEGFIASNSFDERSDQRGRMDSFLEDILNFDEQSSFLFNNALPATGFFFLQRDGVETIIANDALYETCGVDREWYTHGTHGPMDSLGGESKAAMMRAIFEALDKGMSRVTVQVIENGKWVDCIIKYVSPSARGGIFSIMMFDATDAHDFEGTVVQTIQDSEWNVSLLSQIVPNGFIKCALDDDLTIGYIDERLLAHTGLSRDEFTRRYHQSFKEIVLEEDLPELFELIERSRRDGSLVECEVRVHHGYTEQVDLSILGRVSKDSSGMQWFYMLCMVKSDAIELDDMALARKSIPFDYFFDEDRLVITVPSPDGEPQKIVIDDWIATTSSQEIDETRITKASAAKIFATVRDLRDHPVSGFSDIKCNLRGLSTMRWYHINYFCEPGPDGRAAILHGYAQDANDKMGSAKWWRRQAERDYLTGLLNRNAVEQEINVRMQTQGGGMMFMIDLDNFKRVNDELGHLTGDDLLRKVSEELWRHFRESDLLGRYGGDEFVAFMSNGSADSAALGEKRARDIVEAIGKIAIPDGTYAGCSVGVAVSHSPKTTFYDLLEVADQAMYESKVNGKGRVTVVEMDDA